MKYPPVHYHDYLKLDSLLNSQKMRSEEFKKTVHDEMLFITVHQTYELWFKQILFELDSVMSIFSQDFFPDHLMGQSVARLERIVHIQRFINGQVDILETMTPLDFLEFRDFLFPASGFQSMQWRMLETKLGLRAENRLNYNQMSFTKALKTDQEIQMEKIKNQDSLFVLIEKWLERIPYMQNMNFDFWKSYKSAALQMIQEDKSVVQTNPRLSEEEKEKNIKQMESSEKTLDALFDPDQYEELRKQNMIRLSQKAFFGALFITLYRDVPVLQMPFRLIQSLINIDEAMTSWRSRHALMAHRMLGKKIGTGGSSGHDYLKSAADHHKIFADFFNLSTFLIPRSRIPSLPEELKSKMNFPQI